MAKFTVFIDDDGMTHGLKSPVTAALGLRDRQRVSHVEPVNRVLRWLFHFIRNRVTDESRVAGFTRHWPVKWQANIFEGPTLGPFNMRQEAIDAEVVWINNNLEEGLKNESRTDIG
jgi:hypothetical protein